MHIFINTCDDDAMLITCAHVIVSDHIDIKFSADKFPINCALVLVPSIAADAQPRREICGPVRRVI